jgi:hypothetical protein
MNLEKEEEPNIIKKNKVKIDYNLSLGESSNINRRLDMWSADTED